MDNDCLKIHQAICRMCVFFVAGGEKVLFSISVPSVFFFGCCL